MPNLNNKKRVLVLMSDTGGGHRAAAEAIQAAAEIRYPGAYHFDVVDVFRQYMPFPFKNAPEIYPFWVNNAGFLWGLTYRLLDNQRVSRTVIKSLYPAWQRGIRQLLADHPADVIVCVHSLFSRAVMHILCQLAERPPFVTVVTDLVSTHAFWYDHRVDKCLVPTAAAYERGLKFGLTDSQLCLTGLPVHPNFIANLSDTASARQELGLHPSLPAVLLVSGGDGMGPMLRIATAINERRLNCQLMIIAGRNAKLQRQLEAQTWHQPTKIFGFVDFMPTVMAAADMLVTKAGPATISEACHAGLPMIISGAIPGQEDGNVTLVVENGAGIYADSPQRVANAMQTWLAEDDWRRRAENAKSLARPNAVWEILEEIHRQINW